MMSSPKVVSLFSGAGGLDLGFVQAGFDIVWANDIDEDAVATYRENIGDHIWLGDVAEVSAEDIPPCDVLIGGFPCQGFSQANTHKVENDERNQLYKQYLRILRAKRPKVFVAENVRGILTIGGGTAIERIVSDFEGAGYRVQYRLLNAADYGVPQTRRRVIIVGVRSDVGRDFSYPRPTHSSTGAEGLPRWVSMRAAIKGVPDPDGVDADSVPNNVYSRYKVVPRNYTGHRLSNPEKPSPTILARGNGGGGVCALPHYNGRRRLSVHESALIQTFPADYRFFGGLNSCYRQVGNAVPVRLALVIAESVRDVLT